MTAGLTQKQLARMAELSQPAVSQAERGHVDISLEARCRLVAACGHELGWRLYPVASVSMRDSGQLGIANALASKAHRRWSIESERPIRAGDLRAADLLLSIPEEVLHVEVERALVDVQAQLRAAQIKRQIIGLRAARPTRLVIAVPDTRAARRRLASIAPLIEKAFPISSREIWRAVRLGQPVGGDGIVFVRPAAGTQVRPTSRPKPLSAAGRRP
jgi:transcriptional regulator with XRE-family HTH domain